MIQNKRNKQDVRVSLGKAFLILTSGVVFLISMYVLTPSIEEGWLVLAWAYLVFLALWGWLALFKEEIINE